CFLKEDTVLPMMYMDDAIRATITLMEAPPEKLTEHAAYNLAGISFAPKDLAVNISQKIPDFSIKYAPDFRQEIADSWPSDLDDSKARDDWGWAPEFDMEKLTEQMLEGVRESFD